MKRPLVFALLFIILVNIPISSGAAVSHHIRKPVQPQPVQQQHKPVVHVQRPNPPVQKPVAHVNRPAYTQTPHVGAGLNSHPQRAVYHPNTRIGGSINPHPQRPVYTNTPHIGGSINPHIQRPVYTNTPHIGNSINPRPMTPIPHIGNSINPHTQRPIYTSTPHIGNSVNSHPGGWSTNTHNPNHHPGGWFDQKPISNTNHPGGWFNTKNIPHSPHPHIPHDNTDSHKPPVCTKPPCHPHSPHPSHTDDTHKPKPVPDHTSKPPKNDQSSSQSGPSVNPGPQASPNNNSGPQSSSGPQPGADVNPAPQTGPQPSQNTNSGPQQAGPQPDAQQSQPQPQPDTSNGSPCQVAPNRQGIVAAAMWAAKSGKYISYSQGGSRWSGITQKACPFQAVPSVTDCSAFVTWLYWSAFGNGNDFVNGQNWKAGYTGTMGSHGTPVNLAQARPGDIVLYGRAPYEHAVLYVGNNQVVSFGQNGPAKLVPINYRKDYNIRSYLP